MTPTSKALQVLLGNVDVGELVGERDGAVTFRFSASYLRLPNRPVLGQWFEDRLQEDVRVRARLPAWFSNLLPEGALRDMLAKRHGLNRVHELRLLEALGAEDLPGNVRVVPVGGPAPFSLEASAEDTPVPVGSGLLKFSLAGVQLKFSAVKHGKALTIPAKDTAGDWIVKFPDPRFPGVPENEVSMMTWAHLAGLDVAHGHLVARAEMVGVPEEFFAGTDDQAAYAVKRFDRASIGHHIHMEDMAQVFGHYPGEKYAKLNVETLAKLVLSLVGEQGALELVNRTIFNAVIGNGDAHAKNWSLLYRDPQRATLSPAYDLVSTMAYVKGGPEEAALNFAGTKEWRRLDRAALDKFSTRVGLDPAVVAQSVDAFLARVVTAWREHRAEWPMSASLGQLIESHWETVPLLKTHSARL